jgi:hypothetical protein
MHETSSQSVILARGVRMSTRILDVLEHKKGRLNELTAIDLLILIGNWFWGSACTERVAGEPRTKFGASVRATGAFNFGRARQL